MVKFQSILVLELRLKRQKDLKNLLYPNLELKIHISMSKCVICFAHAHIKSIENLKIIHKWVFQYYLTSLKIPILIQNHRQKYSVTTIKENTLLNRNESNTRKCHRNNIVVPIPEWVLYWLRYTLFVYNRCNKNKYRTLINRFNSFSRIRNYNDSIVLSNVLCIICIVCGHGEIIITYGNETTTWLFLLIIAIIIIIITTEIHIILYKIKFSKGYA